MTAIRPNLFKLLAPLATLACGLALFLALNRTGDVEPPGRCRRRGRRRARRRLDRPAHRDPPARGARRPGRGRGLRPLGDAYLDKARENGDPAYYSRADRSFDAALRRDARNVTAVLGRGHAGRTPSRLPRAAAPRPRGAAPRAGPRRLPGDRRRPDRARPLRRPRRARSSACSTSSRTWRRTRARLTTASCRATRPAPSRRCGWPPPPAVRPRTPPTCRCSWATSSFNAAVSAPRARPTSVRCDRCRLPRRDWSDSHELTRRAAIWGEPPLACVGPSPGCR